MRKTVSEKASLGHAIAFFRKKKGLTQIQLASLCGSVSNVFISKVEAGQKYPTAELLEKIVANLGISRDELLNKAMLFGDENPSPKKLQFLQDLKKLVDELLDKELMS